jgi:short-subunit dehydrogenase
MKNKLFLSLLFLCSMSINAVPQKIVVIGATSDIGRALVKILLAKNHIVVAVDDDVDPLTDLQNREGEKLITKHLPINDAERAREGLIDIVEQIGGLDICILCCAIAPEIEEYGLLKSGHIPWDTSRETIAVNVMGTTALANIALNHFIENKKGYLVGVSSLDALHGHPGCPCYTASKAFLSNYLEAMRQKCKRLDLKNVTISDIRWSFVNQIKNDVNIGWTESPEQAALEMLKAIEEKKPVAYIMSKWNFMLWALTNIPALLRNAVSGISGLRQAQG